MKSVLVITIALLAWQNVTAFPFFGHEYERTPLGDSIDKATMNILQEAYKVGEDKNVVTSPLGVLLLLSLYADGAGPQSKQEISNILGGGDYKHLSESYSRLSNRFAAMDPSYLTLCNKIYVAQQYELNDAFARTASSYKSEVDKMDFSDPERAAEIINAWSNEKTRGHIKEPVSSDILTRDTVAALFNIIFFQGHWHVPFNANHTSEKDFYVDKSTTVKKPTMKLVQSLFYRESEELGAKMVELPYKETGFRMVIVLPNEVEGLPSVLEKASQKGLLEDVFLLNPSGRDIDLEFPKFEIKSKLDLNEILPKVGISQIFKEGAGGIVRDASITVSKAFQEAFVKVDEEGATAGAFTGMIAVPTSSLSVPPPPMAFKVDRPFLFTILYNDKVLFAGTYVH